MTPITVKNIKKFRQNLKQGKHLIGGWIQISNSNIVEIISDFKYDWIALDLEHGFFSVKDLPEMFRSAELKDKLPLVRLPNKNIEIMAQALDAGAAGIIIPNIKNKKELISIRNSCYLPPHGKRGVGYSRANLFGKKFKEFSKQKIKPIIVAMIENIEATNDLENILSVEGLDAILIGPYDLSSSMKITGKFNHPKFISITKKIKKLAKKFKVPSGFHVINPNMKVLKNYIRDGYQFLPYCTDTILLNSAIENSFKINK